MKRGTVTREITDLVVSRSIRYGWSAEKEVWFRPRRIDVLAIAPRGVEVIGFEVKASEGDLYGELRDPSKRGAVAKYCTQFYIVVPRTIADIAQSKVPLDCGLLVVNQGNLVVWRYSPGYTDGSLPFELPDSFCEYYRDSLGDQRINDQYPRWMLPAFHRPFRFQFDILKVAAKMASAILPPFEIDFDGVPF